jgi:hypothetical protein
MNRDLWCRNMPADGSDRTADTLRATASCTISALLSDIPIDPGENGTQEKSAIFRGYINEKNILVAASK